MRSSILVATGAAAVVAGSLVSAPALAHSEKTVPVKLAGYLFNNKPNLKLTAKVGDSAKFTWAGGFHNVKTQKAPAGAKKVDTGAPIDKHAPLSYTFTKPGTYVLYCAPHRALGMIVTITVK
jgi:plastocyanin